MNNRKSKEIISKEIESKLNEGYNFVDYFLTIGSNPSIFQNTWLYQSDIYTLNTKYKEKLKPIMINRFPSKDKKYIGFDDAIIYHCFPEGFKVYEFNKQPEYKIFSILLDNNNYSINYPFKYVVCLKFYECISNYKKLYDKYNEIKEKQIPKDSDINNNDEEMKSSKSWNIDFKKIRKISLATPSIKYNKNGDIYFPEPLDGDISSSDYNSSDIKLNFNEAQKFFGKGNNIINNIDNNSSKNNIENNYYKKYYIPKCICLISLYPFITEMSKIIKHIYQYSLVGKQIYPLEKIINNLLIEVPVPPKGIYSIEYSLINESIMLKATQKNDFHVLNIEFQKLFMIFKLNYILDIFRHLMLNTRVIIFSEEIKNLTPVMLSLLSLLYPFQYPYNAVSVLHKDVYKFIEHITPFFVGINERYNPNFFKENDLDITEYILIVNMDKQELIKLEPESQKNKLILPELPYKYKTALENKINNYITKIKINKKKNGKGETPKILQQTIRTFFLEFQTDLMKDYTKYLNNDIYKYQDDYKNWEEKAFKLKEFINKVPNEYQPFYEYFLRTQTFSDFLEKRMTPRDKNVQIDILFFEELMLKNKNEAILLNSQSYNITKKIIVPKPPPLSSQQIYYFNHFDTNNKSLLNGIEISNRKESFNYNRGNSFSIENTKYLTINNKNTSNKSIIEELEIENESNEHYDDENNYFNDINNNYNAKKSMSFKVKNSKELKTKEERISSKKNYNKNLPLFSYIIFPKLDCKYFFNSDINNYHIDYTMYQEIKNIDNEILSKSHLSRVKIKTNESTNYIHLLWLKLWVASFYYHDKQEQKYRFFQMLHIIDRLSQYEMGVINNLFNVLLKYKMNDDLILLLYEKILHYKLILSDFIFRKIGILISKKKSIQNSKTFDISKYVKSLKDSINKEFKEAIMIRKKFRKRTLKSEYDTQILDEKVTFLIEENCEKCDSKIEMSQFMNNINNEVNNDLFWAKCPYCGKNYLPEIKIIFGSENNKNNKLMTTTSIVDNVMLYSPKTLNLSLFENIKENNEMNIDEFKAKYNPFFWNIIWHFQINKLPFDFILPYEDNILQNLIKKQKITKNGIGKNMNNFCVSNNYKLIFSDYIKKEKEKLDYKRKLWSSNTELIVVSNEIDIYIPPRNNYNKYNYLRTSSSNYSHITTYD